MYDVNKLNEVKMSCLVTDIETSSFWPNGGGEINIQSHFDEYVEFAETKFIGMYSYRDDYYYFLNMTVESDREIAKRLLATHKIIVGFSSAEFDFPILKNNDFTGKDNKGKDMWYSQVDCLHILGASNYQNRAGYSFKNRGELMGYNFKNNKLRTIAEAMGLKTQKGDIDYKIFQKNSWTDEELKKIQIYLKGDVMATKEMFDELWKFWIPFVEMLDEKSVYDLSWLRLSIASLTYKCACNVMTIEPTYGEYKGEKEEMGGKVILPKTEEARKVWYVDFASLYPHIFCMFNLFAETDKQDGEHIWHGNNIFKVKGYYDISQKHILTMHVIEKLKERINLKKTAPDDPMIYALKIFLNCYSKNTDILMADNSIKNIKDCKIGELVYSINPETLIAEKKKIKKCFEYNYNGEMHHYKSHYFDFNVTPKHRFLLTHKNGTQDNIFIESRDIQSQHKIPMHKEVNNYKKNINILDYIKKDELLYSVKPTSNHGRTWLYNNALSYLIGMYLAEGSTSILIPKVYTNGNVRGKTYSISISQYKEVNPVIYKKITDALDICGLRYSAGKQTIKISGVVFYNFIVNNFGKLDYKCFHNKKMFNDLNVKKVFEGLIDGDGSKKHRLFTTKYDCLRDDFIELCMRLGYTFTLKNDGCWRIIYNNNSNSFRKENRTINNYNDKVYCIEVEDNNTLMAGQNKKFNWSGNSLYGVARSDIFDQVGGKNCGWDCCDLGQQIHGLLEETMNDFGFDLIGGDTDSGFFIARDDENNNRDYVIECLRTIVDIIKDNVPFPVDTFGIDIENYIEYILFPHSMDSISFKKIKLKKDDVLNEEISDSVWVSLRKYYKDMSDDDIFENVSNIVLKGIDKEENKLNLKIKNHLIREWTGKKKNYLYLYKKKDKETGEMKDDIKLVGLPIKKANATKLAISLYEDILKPTIFKQRHAKFTKEEIVKNINIYLAKPEVMSLIAREWKVKASDTYAKETQIQAQISRGYFGGEEGVITLITNNKIGNAGKGKKYCTVQEAIDANLTADDLDLDKVYKELDPFIIYVPKVKKPKIVKEKKPKKKSTKKKTVKKVAKSK